jgi:hypothetical protein
MADNVKRFPINKNSMAKANCQSNAAARQRITLRWGDDNEVCFEGVGENKNMTLEDGTTTVYEFPPQSDDFEVEATFEHQQLDDPYEWRASTVTYHTDEMVDDNHRSIDIRTEDANDNDDNDSCLTIIITLNSVQV